jgi:ATP phosphoribosyltransferase-like protein
VIVLRQLVEARAGAAIQTGCVAHAVAETRRQRRQLRGALDAQHMVGLKFNLPKSALDKVTAALPALRNPTISPLSDAAWVAVETLIDNRLSREIIPTLKSHGAEGIFEYSINKLVR